MPGDPVFVQISEALTIVKENMPLVNGDAAALQTLIDAIEAAVFPPDVDP